MHALSVLHRAVLPGLLVVLSAVLVLLPIPASAQQQPTPATASPTTRQALSQAASPSVTVIQETSSVLSIAISSSGTQPVTLSTFVLDVVSVTSTLGPPPTASRATTNTSTTAPASATPNPFVLDTKVDPGFGVLGAILILTGLPSAFLGHKNRWTSFFLIGFYTLALVCLVLILRFGVIDAVFPPSKSLRGLYVLACVVAGVAGGGISVFFWKAAKYFIGAWGGFAFALWIQCFRDGGLIRPVGLRWILYIGCAVVGFVACTISKLHYHVLLVSTAIVGSTSIILGADCFSTAGLKEFYVWNLGFDTLFPKFTRSGIAFPVSQTMQIELGLIGAIAVMGAAVQFRVLAILQRKLEEIKDEQRRRDAVDDAKTAEQFLKVEEEKAEWSRKHPSLGRYGRQSSDHSGMALMKDHDAPNTPDTEAGTSVFGTRARRPSGVSEFLAATPSDDELVRVRGFHGYQTPGVLPALDLGRDIQENVPRLYMSDDADRKKDVPSAREDAKRKDELLAEIETIRRSIDNLRTESQSNLGSRSRHHFSTAVLPEAVHARPPRSGDPRAHIRSMDMGSHLSSLGPAISRSTSAPVQDEDWDAYVRERRLFQPPAGVTDPIPTTPLPTMRPPSPRVAMSPAIQDALARRHQRESTLLTDNQESESKFNHNVTSPVPQAPAGTRRPGSYLPPTILPPQKRSAPETLSPVQAVPRTVTYEELSERHREKMRELQSPLTREQNERAEIENARARWERSKAVERREVERRQAERAQAAASRQPPVLDAAKRSSADPATARHSRSLSADKLVHLGGAMGSNSKRASMLKVEDWQRYQAEVGKEPPLHRSTSSGGPFPGPNERRSSRRMSAMSNARNPPS